MIFVCSNWENGLNESRIHSKIEQIDGHIEDYKDEKFDASKHYWKSGWLGQSFIDADEVLEECDIPDENKHVEKAKILEARKMALGSNFKYFPPWDGSK